MGRRRRSLLSGKGRPNRPAKTAATETPGPADGTQSDPSPAESDPPVEDPSSDGPPDSPATAEESLPPVHIEDLFEPGEEIPPVLAKVFADTPPAAYSALDGKPGAEDTEIDGDLSAEPDAQPEPDTGVEEDTLREDEPNPDPAEATATDSEPEPAAAPPPPRPSRREPAPTPPPDNLPAPEEPESADGQPVGWLATLRERTWEIGVVLTLVGLSLVILGTVSYISPKGTTGGSAPLPADVVSEPADAPSPVQPVVRPRSRPDPAPAEEPTLDEEVPEVEPPAPVARPTPPAPQPVAPEPAAPEPAAPEPDSPWTQTAPAPPPPPAPIVAPDPKTSKKKGLFKKKEN